MIFLDWPFGRLRQIKAIVSFVRDTVDILLVFLDTKIIWGEEKIGKAESEELLRNGVLDEILGASSHPCDLEAGTVSLRRR
jgi:hypothetical protein